MADIQFVAPVFLHGAGRRSVSWLDPGKVNPFTKSELRPNWETVPQPEITHSWGPSVLLPLATAELA